MTTMLYKHPGPHHFHGGDFDYIIVEDDKVADAIKDGWALTTTEARDSGKAADAPAPEAPRRGRPRKTEE